MDQQKLQLAKNGNSQAQAYIGNCYHNGIGTPKDDKKAFEWFSKSAHQGNAEEQNNLGFCYENGIGTPKDEKKAFEWYSKSAQQGNALGQNNLGFCYQNGIGTPKDEKKAFEWYLKSAQQEDAYGQNNLGFCYQNGIGTPKDEKKAFEWYSKSAQQGDARGQSNLGFCYEMGIGTPKDEKKAFEWFSKSAQQEDVKGQYNLGFCYQNGIGTPKDEKKAFEWFSKSAQQGDDDPHNKLASLHGVQDIPSQKRIEGEKKQQTKKVKFLVEYQDRKLIIDTSLSSMDALQKVLLSKIGDSGNSNVFFQMFDKDFNEFVEMEDFDLIPVNGKIIVEQQKQNFVGKISSLTQQTQNLQEIPKSPTQGLKLDLFQPIYKRSFVVINSIYKGPLPSLSGCMKDLSEITSFVTNDLGISFEDQKVFLNSQASEIQDALNRLHSDVYACSKGKSKGFIFFYFSGHGCFEGTDTWGYDGNGNIFELSKFIKKLKSIPNHFTLGLFDCCRDIPQVTNLEIPKGVILLETEISDKTSHGQSCMIFGSKPGEKAVARADNVSLMTSHFLEHVRKTTVPFPLCMTDWEFLVKKGEYVPWCNMQIALLPNMKVNDGGVQ